MSTPGHSDLMVGSSGTCTQICNHQINSFNLINDVVMVKQSTLNGEMQKTVHVVQIIIYNDMVPHKMIDEEDWIKLSINY
jgi:hypothetical protein